MNAFDTAWALLKKQPRFAFHVGNAPIGDPLDPSKLPSNEILTTLEHNEILERPHGIFAHPIGGNNKYKTHQAITKPTYNRLNNFLIDMMPYADKAFVGDYSVADSLGYHGQSLQEILAEINNDEEGRMVEGMESVYGDYDDEQQEMIEMLLSSIPDAYEPYIKDFSDWEGDRWELPPKIGSHEYVQIGDMWNSNEVELIDRNPQDTFEVIIPDKISPDDYFPLNRNSGIDDVKEWMKDRVGDNA